MTKCQKKKPNNGHFHSQNNNSNIGMMNNNYMKSNVDQLSYTIPEEENEEQ